MSTFPGRGFPAPLLPRAGVEFTGGPSVHELLGSRWQADAGCLGTDPDAWFQPAEGQDAGDAGVDPLACPGPGDGGGAARPSRSLGRGEAGGWWPLSRLRPGVHRPGRDRVSSGAVLKLIQQHVRAAGLSRITLHDVRHSYATAALAAGVPAKVVSERLGHANIAITMDTYRHVLPGLDEQAAGRAARTIPGAGDPVPGMLREQTVSIRPPASRRVRIANVLVGGGVRAGDSNPHGLPHRDLNHVRGVPGRPSASH
jgi:hypothetical protein